MKKDKHYIDNDEFYALLIEFQEFSKDYKNLLELKRNNKIKMLIEKVEFNLKRNKNKIGKMFISICNGVLNRPNFVNYSPDRKDEMISDACFYMSKYINNFKRERKNPFSYFTQICRNAFLQNLNKVNQHNDRTQPLCYIENIHKENNLFDEQNY